jgi:hypothetical protein
MRLLDIPYATLTPSAGGQADATADPNAIALDDDNAPGEQVNKAVVADPNEINLDEL